VRTLADGLGTVGQPMGYHARVRSRKAAVRMSDCNYSEPRPDSGSTDRSGVIGVTDLGESVPPMS
jgi:hypothetical protein